MYIATRKGMAHIKVELGESLTISFFPEGKSDECLFGLSIDTCKIGKSETGLMVTLPIKRTYFDTDDADHEPDNYEYLTYYVVKNEKFLLRPFRIVEEDNSGKRPG